jgi:hypothetical protein
MTAAPKDDIANPVAYRPSFRPALAVLLWRRIGQARGAILHVRRFFNMRRLLSTAALLLLTQNLAQPALAQGKSTGIDPAPAAPARVQLGTVRSVDTVTMNFICQTNRMARQYWVTRSTRLIAGRSRISFFALRSGQQVQVISHENSGLEIADTVVL